MGFDWAKAPPINREMSWVEPLVDSVHLLGLISGYWECWVEVLLQNPKEICLCPRGHCGMWDWKGRTEDSSTSTNWWETKGWHYIAKLAPTLSGLTFRGGLIDFQERRCVDVMGPITRRKDFKNERGRVCFGWDTLASTWVISEIRPTYWKHSQRNDTSLQNLGREIRGDLLSSNSSNNRAMISLFSLRQDAHIKCSLVAASTREKGTKRRILSSKSSCHP